MRKNGNYYYQHIAPQLLKLELICTGPVWHDDFDQASDDFEEECTTVSFWKDRNTTILSGEDWSAHDYRCDTIVRFDITDVSFLLN